MNPFCNKTTDPRSKLHVATAKINQNAAECFDEPTTQSKFQMQFTSKTYIKYFGTHRQISNLTKTKNIERDAQNEGRITRSAILIRPSRRESFLILRRWNWMRPAHGSDAGSNKCLILSLYTSTASTLCSVSDMSFSQRCEPMKPPAPIMHIVIGFIGFPSRSTLPAISKIRSLLSLNSL